MRVVRVWSTMFWRATRLTDQYNSLMCWNGFPDAASIKLARSAAIGSESLRPLSPSSAFSAIDSIVAIPPRKVISSEEARLRELDVESPDLNADDLRTLLPGLDAVPAALAVATPEERKALYNALGVSLVYDPVEKVVHAQQDLASCWGYQSVGGGT